MNKVFKVVFNKALGIFIAVGENSKSVKKNTRSSVAQSASQLLLASSVLLSVNAMAETVIGKDNIIKNMNNYTYTVIGDENLVKGDFGGVTVGSLNTINGNFNYVFGDFNNLNPETSEGHANLYLYNLVLGTNNNVLGGGNNLVGSVSQIDGYKNNVNLAVYQDAYYALHSFEAKKLGLNDIADAYDNILAKFKDYYNGEVSIENLTDYIISNDWKQGVDTSPMDNVLTGYLSQVNSVTGYSNQVSGSYVQLNGSENTFSGTMSLINAEQSNIFGNRINADGLNTNILGSNINSDGDFNNLIGSNNSINGSNVNSIGSSNTVLGNSVTSIGSNSTFEGSDNISIGSQVLISGNSNYSFGNKANIVGSQNTSIGENLQILGSNNNAIGKNVVTGTDNNVLGGLTVKGLNNNVVASTFKKYIVSSSTESGYLESSVKDKGLEYLTALYFHQDLANAYNAVLPDAYKLNIGDHANINIEIDKWDYKISAYFATLSEDEADVISEKLERVMEVNGFPAYEALEQKMDDMLEQGLSEEEIFAIIYEDYKNEYLAYEKTVETIETFDETPSVVNGDYAVGIGAGINIQADNAIAIGSLSSVTANEGIAIGANATVTTEGSIALGSNSNASGKGLDQTAYLIGGLATSELNISNGSEGRRITGVAGGYNDSDAVNVAQLKQLAKSTEEAVSQINNRIDNIASEGVTASDGISSEIIEELKGSIAETNSALALTDKAVQANKDAIAETNSALALTDKAVQDNKDAIAETDKAIQGIKEATLDQVKELLISGSAENAVKYETNAEGDINKDKILLSGLDGTAIANVADGRVEIDSKDAVNGSQLNQIYSSMVSSLGGGAKLDSVNSNFTPPTYTLSGKDYVGVENALTALDAKDQALEGKISNLEQSFNNQLGATNQQIRSVEKRLSAGVAQALSMESAPYAAGKLSYAVGAAHYNGEQAIGATFRLTAENGKWSVITGVSGGSQGEAAFKVGVSGIID